MEESFKYHIPEDIPANERTAFHGAAAAAAKAGKKNFNFAGKTHPVTMKKDTATAIADQKESTMSFREKLMSIFESDRAKHYKSAAAAEPMDNNLKGAGAKKMKADIQGNAADPDLEKKSHDDAAKAGRAGPSMKARSNDNKKGDKKIINPPTDETKKGQGPKVATESINKTQEKESVMNENKEHPHEEAIEDHQSQAREHKDNLYDNPKTSGKHHKAAYHAHMDAADHLEYGRTKEAKAAAKKAVFHAKKAKELGGADHTAETNRIYKAHHSSTNENYGISGNALSNSLLEAVKNVTENKSKI